ncbi:hypothetical protein ETB97_010341 [Aspergillus alliaceus]|uniref:Uncharacterized protein n=1 Tax=Petromyces alliaceus TaxID=209559 RepID=A0A8H6E190_PETAA|nr:hypothetical protein ETB97_010341 [Aspergillus burnettii]
MHGHAYSHTPSQEKLSHALLQSDEQREPAPVNGIDFYDATKMAPDNFGSFLLEFKEALESRKRPRPQGTESTPTTLGPKALKSHKPRMTSKFGAKGFEGTYYRAIALARQSPVHSKRKQRRQKLDDDPLYLDRLNELSLA